jgi:multidrug transporter EmrE-like cation transporter
LASIYQAIAKETTMHQGIEVIDLVFVRVCINFLSSLGTVRYSGKHVINDVPRKYWKLLLIRCIAGTLGFTCLVYSVKTIPLFIGIIIFNTTPFIASILGYYFLGDKVSKTEMKLMIGCFIGVLALALAKGGCFRPPPEMPGHGGHSGPHHRFLKHHGGPPKHGQGFGGHGPPMYGPEYDGPEYDGPEPHHGGPSPLHKNINGP